MVTVARATGRLSAFLLFLKGGDRIYDGLQVLHAELNRPLLRSETGEQVSCDSSELLPGHLR